MQRSKTREVEKQKYLQTTAPIVTLIMKSGLEPVYVVSESGVVDD